MYCFSRDFWCSFGMILRRQYLAVIAGILLLYLILTLYGVHEKFDVTSLRTGQLPSKLVDFARYFKPDFADIITGRSVQVLILTYMRSGSSLTGDILQHSPGAFYIYEPFRALGHKDKDSFTIQYGNGTIRKPPFKFEEEAYENLYNWFTCNLTNLPNIGLSDGFLKKGLKSSMMLVCLKHMRGTMNVTQAIYMCARQLQGICEQSPFRIIKTIRMHLSDVSHLLDELPNLKIVHLVRDPRATLFSQAHFGKCSEKKGGRPGCTNEFCRRLEHDVLEEENILKKYPNRIMPVFYHDIAREPLKTSKKLYDFIGAEFTPEAERYIFNITMAGNQNNCAICTTRSNSSEHIDTWKEKMDPSFIKIINERCNYIIKRYEFDEHPVQ